jgi:hypothetical protein
MISEPTVLILGAGASQPYGFPIGSGLKDRTLQGLSNDAETDLYLSSGDQIKVVEVVNHLGEGSMRCLRLGKERTKTRIDKLNLKVKCCDRSSV